MGRRDLMFTKEQTEAAIAFQQLLIRNGALIIWPEPGLYGHEERNVFNYDVT